MEFLLYTFIMNYLGGTYVSQVIAPDPESGMRFWIKKLNTKDIEGFSENDKQKLIQEDFVNEEPVLLTGLDNVWHFLILTEKGTGFVYFVKTLK